MLEMLTAPERFCAPTAAVPLLEPRFLARLERLQDAAGTSCHVLAAQILVGALNVWLDEYEALLTGNPIWRERNRGVGLLDAATAESLGVSGPLLRAAGVARDAVVWKLTTEAWQAVLDVHLTGTFNVTRAVIPPMRAAGFGRILFASDRHLAVVQPRVVDPVGDLEGQTQHQAPIFVQSSPRRAAASAAAPRRSGAAPADQSHPARRRAGAAEVRHRPGALDHALPRSRVAVARGRLDSRSMALPPELKALAADTKAMLKMTS